MAKKRKTLLVIGAHMDDCEAGAAGTMFKAIDQGLRVVMINTIGNFSNRPDMVGADLEAARKQVIDLAKRMGAEKIMLDYKYHQYPDTLAARKEMAEVIADVKPDIGIIHHTEDYWVDHRITGFVSRDALIHTDGLAERMDFRPCRNIYAFGGVGHQGYAFNPDTFVDVTPYIDKIAWVRFELDKLMSPGLPDEKYFRQHVKVFHPADPSLNRKFKVTAHAEKQLAHLRSTGNLANTLYAEPFQAIFKRTRELW